MTRFERWWHSQCLQLPYDPDLIRIGEWVEETRADGYTIAIEWDGPYLKPDGDTDDFERLTVGIEDIVIATEFRFRFPDFDVVSPNALPIEHGDYWIEREIRYFEANEDIGLYLI
jgi:hypothetical protein